MPASLRPPRRILAAAAVVALFLLCAASGSAETVQRGQLRVSFAGRVAPTRLPRRGTAPIAVRVGGHVRTTDLSIPPQLQRIEIAINRHGRFDFAGLPTCRLAQIQPSTSAEAMRACGDAKVGEGRFAADVVIPAQSPFPSQGRMVAFNGVEDGRPVILAHVYGEQPIPTSYTLLLQIRHTPGTFGTVLTADLPTATSAIAFVTDITLTLGRSYRYRGQTHSYLSAGCPAPNGFPGTVFPLVRASFGFAGGPALTSVLNRSCKASG
jgi:hypothetical protein